LKLRKEIGLALLAPLTTALPSWAPVMLPSSLLVVVVVVAMLTLLLVMAWRLMFVDDFQMIRK
jgi:hypothetical protein